jgi:hypothetical protein
LFRKEEFAKVENGPKKVPKLEEQLYKSLANNSNELSEHFISSLSRFIEGKLQRKIANMTIEFFMTGNSQIYLSGLEKI